MAGRSGLLALLFLTWRTILSDPTHGQEHNMESHASVGKVQRVAAILISAMLIALGATSSASAAEDAQTHRMRDQVFGQDDPNAAVTLPSEQVRQELLAARERAWRFVLSFQNDPAAVQRIY